MHPAPRNRTPVPSLAAALLTVLALASGAAAAERVLRLSPESSEITFLLDATAHDVHGTLYLTAGEVRFDPATGAATGRIEIDASRAETGNASRDRKMHKQVLETERFPLFVFVPDRFEGSVADEGSTEVELHGTLSIHGGEHPMTLPAQVEWGADGTVRAISEIEIPYVDWGMDDPSVLFLRVADRVTVTVKVVGRWAPAAGATP